MAITNTNCEQGVEALRYRISGVLRRSAAQDLAKALADRSFSSGFPYGDLGNCLRKARVGPSGQVDWIEVCYCREAYGVAMYEELPFFEPYFDNLIIADARDPDGCKGYPECGTCDCTAKVNLVGEPFVDYLDRVNASAAEPPAVVPRPPKWTGWRGNITTAEAERNRNESCN